MEPASDEDQYQVHQPTVNQYNVENSTAKISNEHKSGGDATAVEAVDRIGATQQFKEYQETIMAQGEKLDNSMNRPQDEQMTTSMRRAEIRKLIDDMDEFVGTVTMTDEQRAEIKELIDDVVETVFTTDDQITVSIQQAEIKKLLDEIKSKYTGDETVGTTSDSPCHCICSSSCKTRYNKGEDRSRPTFKTNQSCKKLLQSQMTGNFFVVYVADSCEKCSQWITVQDDDVSSETESGTEVCRKNRKKENVIDEEDLEHHKPKQIRVHGKTSAMSRYSLEDDFDFVNKCAQSQENGNVDRDMDTGNPFVDEDVLNATPSQVGMRQLFESEEIISANCVRHLKDLRKSLNKIMKVLLFFESRTSSRSSPRGRTKRSGAEVAELDLDLPTSLNNATAVTSASDEGNLSPTTIRAAEETLLKYMLDVETQLHSELVSLNHLGSRVEDLNMTAAEWQSGVGTSAGGDKSSAGGMETSAGGNESSAGGVDTSAGGVETSASGDESSGNEETSDDGMETNTGGDKSSADGVETSVGGGESSADGVETSAGGEETSNDGVDTCADGDESSAVVDQTSVGGGESSVGGVDTSAGGSALCTDSEEVGII